MHDDLENGRISGCERRMTDALGALLVGKGILLVDDESRENEGDLIFAAEKMRFPGWL